MGMIPSAFGCRGANSPCLGMVACMPSGGASGSVCTGATVAPSPRPVLSLWNVRTSSLVTRPRGPVPWTCDRSTRSSAARRRARGDTGCRSSSRRLGAGAATCRPGADVAIPGSSVSGNSSPASPMYAIGLPTATVAPAWQTIRSSSPLAGASNSITALSVSISAMTSFATTESPSCFIQETIVAFSMSYPIRGITTSCAIGLRLPPPVSACPSPFPARLHDG